MEKYTKKRMLALLMVGIICSQHFSTMHAAEKPNKTVLAIVPAMVLVATGYYFGYRYGFHDGKQAEQEKRKNPLED